MYLKVRNVIAKYIISIIYINKNIKVKLEFPLIRLKTFDEKNNIPVLNNHKINKLIDFIQIQNCEFCLKVFVSSQLKFKKDKID